MSSTFKLNSISYIQTDLWLETPSDFDELNSLFIDHLAINDKQNQLKLFSYLIDSLSMRIFMGHDELNCVQIAHYLDDLITNLINFKQFVLVAYSLLEIVLRNLLAQLDSIEFNQQNSKLVNQKLFSNTFFISSLISKRIDSSLKLFTFLIESYRKQSSLDDSLLIKNLIKCILSRLSGLLVTCLARKLNKFDSYIELNFFKNLYPFFHIVFSQNDQTLTQICLQTIDLLHSTSLNSFNNCLIAENSEFSNIEILTKKCSSVWNLYTVKKTFSLAKRLLFYEENNEENELGLNDDLNEDKVNGDDIDNRSDISNEENEFKRSNEDKNFYRDFTIRFLSKEEHEMKKANMSKIGSFFSTFTSETNEIDDKRQINLTNFIISFRFHLNLVNLMRNLMQELICSEVDEILVKFLQMFANTYLTSVQIDRNLSFKILLSKIFYLNYENRLANFINLTKISFYGVNLLFCKFYLNQKFNSVHDEQIEFDINLDITELPSRLSLSELEIELREHFTKKEICLEKFFFKYLLHLSEYYLELNRISHHLELDKSIFNKIINEPEIDEIEQNSAKVDSRVTKLFKFYQENNKSMAMKDLTDGVHKNSEDFVNNEDLYLRKDCRFRYQIWSNEMISSIMINLPEKINSKNSYFSKLVELCDNSDDDLRKMLFAFIDLIIVFNSCSSYCQCTAVEFNSKIDVQRSKEISAKLLSFIIRILKPKSK